MGTYGIRDGRREDERTARGTGGRTEAERSDVTGGDGRTVWGSDERYPRTDGRGGRTAGGTDGGSERRREGGSEKLSGTDGSSDVRNERPGKGGRGMNIWREGGNEERRGGSRCERIGEGREGRTERRTRRDGWTEGGRERNYAG